MIDKHKVRARFNHYRQQIAELKSVLENCREELAESYDRAEETVSRAESRARASESERIERERQAESDRWYREGQLKRATSDLERAVSYGDDYGIERATEKIKKANLY